MRPVTNEQNLSQAEREHLDSLFGQGLRAMDEDDFSRAVNLFKEIMDGGFRNAVLLTTYGNALKGLGRFDQACAACQEALDAQPTDCRYWMNLGAVLLASGDWQKSVALYEEALSHFPAKSEVHFNLGTAWLAGRELERAESSLQRAVSFDAASAQAWMNLGAVRKLLGKIDSSREAYETAVNLEKDCAEAQWNLSLAELSAGEFASGWERYEWRRQVADIPVRDFPLREWDGRMAPEENLLVHSEQGLGDTLQFIRFLAFAKERVKTVCALVPRPLCPILELADIADHVAGDIRDLPPCHLHIPMLSLPRLTGEEFLDRASGWPYLKACASRQHAWEAKLAGTTHFRVAIAWQGNPGYREDKARSVPLLNFEPLCQNEKVELWALQKGNGLEQVGAFRPQAQLMLPGADLDTEHGAFMDSAALMTQVNLVVTSDTAIAHLAGGLGVPVWLVLPYVADWRWGQDGQETIWYPTMRIFRQGERGDWQSVFARVAHELDELALTKIA